MKAILAILACAFASTLFSQSNIQQSLSVNGTGAAPDPSAQIDVSANNKGMLVPRMTSMERAAIASPVNGLLVYDTSTNSFWHFNGTAWVNLTTARTLQDADGNTKVQVEKNPNEDIIRFDLGGTESMVLRKNASGIPRLELTHLLNNTFVGLNAGQANTTGFDNTANGREALFSNTDGSLNTATGSNALFSNTSGYNNTANGMSALYSNTTGFHNTANGKDALLLNTTGDYNTANGGFALYHTTGNGNTANGLSALFSNTTGSNNTANGWSALSLNTTGFNNTASGLQALNSNTTGHFNSALGAYSDVSSGNLNKATALGYNAKVGCSNCLVLGGTGDDAVNVGIGTTNPAARLEVENGAVLFEGTTGGTPISGAGTRLMWIPAKAAFRAGEVTGTHWDADSIGVSSAVVGGLDNKASGIRSFVGGGFDNTASASESFVGGGFGNAASSFYSYVGGGFDNAASGSESFVGGGSNNTASGNNSFIGGGFDNAASGSESFVGGGFFNTASGSNSFVGGGQNLLAKSFSEAVFGTFDTDYTPMSTTGINASDRLFVIGNGTGTGARSNAVTVMKNGDFGIGTSNPKYDFHMSNGAASGLSIGAGNGAVITSSSIPRFYFEHTGAATNKRVMFQEYRDGLFKFSATNDAGTGFVNEGIVVIDGVNARLGVGRDPMTNKLEVEGNASKSSAGDWLANSDARLKKNIQPLNSQLMLQSLLALQGVTYEWNDDKTGSKRPEGIQYGFTAQDIREVFPTLVEEDKLGYLQTAYGTYDAMTVEAIRALNEKVESLESENTALKSQLDRITAALAGAGIAVEK